METKSPSKHTQTPHLRIIYANTILKEVKLFLWQQRFKKMNGCYGKFTTMEQQNTHTRVFTPSNRRW